MKRILLTLCLASFATSIYADCRSLLVYGQHKQVCDSADNISSSQNTIEYTEIPPTAKQPVAKNKVTTEKYASLEKSVQRAHEKQSPFKPTHTQLNQVHQLLEYAKSQGCVWGGKYEKPLLICPE